MIADLCPHCGQALPRVTSHLTARELDVLTYWWMEGTVKRAASRAGVGEQRAKNLLSHARIRNGVDSNQQLLAMHFVAVRSSVSQRMSQNNDRTEAA